MERKRRDLLTPRVRSVLAASSRPDFSIAGSRKKPATISKAASTGAATIAARRTSKADTTGANRNAGVGCGGEVHRELERLWCASRYTSSTSLSADSTSASRLTLCSISAPLGTSCMEPLVEPRGCNRWQPVANRAA
jgi:hypothetical protein